MESGEISFIGRHTFQQRVRRARGSITEIVALDENEPRKNESRSAPIASIRRSINLRPELLTGAAQSRGRVLTNKESGHPEKRSFYYRISPPSNVIRRIEMNWNCRSYRYHRLATCLETRFMLFKNFAKKTQLLEKKKKRKNLPRIFFLNVATLQTRILISRASSL